MDTFGEGVGEGTVALAFRTGAGGTEPTGDALDVLFGECGGGIGGSAFAHYREIDMEMKQELVGLID